MKFYKPRFVWVLYYDENMPLVYSNANDDSVIAFVEYNEAMKISTTRSTFKHKYFRKFLLEKFGEIK